MSSPGTPPTPRPEALKKLAQLSIERLKKEEEEEQWISGEELYTEGSSDEDDTAVRAKRKGNEKGVKKPLRSAGNKPKKHIRDGKLKFQNHLSPPQLNLPSCSDVQTSSHTDTGKDKKGTVCTELDPKAVTGDTLASSSTAHDDEVPAEISWRPKRGLPNQSRTPVDVDEAYLAVIEKVRKLKELLADESSISLKKIENQADSHLGNKCFGSIKPNGKINLCNLLSNDWNFLQQRCDLESAFSNMNLLDQLLEIIDQKQKEARKETLDIQLQIRDELSQLCESQAAVDEEISKNTNNFLQFCLCAGRKDNLKDTKSLIKKDLQDMECNTEYRNYTEILEGRETETELLEIVNENFSFEYKAKKCQSSMTVSKDNSVCRDTKDNTKTISYSNDEEKRLNVLLDDNSEFQINDLSELHDATSNSTFTAHYRRTAIHDAYSLNQEAKVTLEIINERLKGFSRTQNNNGILRKISYLPDDDRDMFEDKYKIGKGNHEKLQLHKIDTLLESLKEPSNDEIQPLTNEQITALVKASVANIHSEKDTNKLMDKALSENAESLINEEEYTTYVQNMKLQTKHKAENIKMMVSDAKLSMPHFKFKHSH